MDIAKHQFRVALSFPGEHRAFIDKLAERLAERLPREQIFYDRWYKEALAVFDLDALLEDIYRQRSELLVVFLCREYAEKKWCQLEWRVARDLRLNGKAESIMLVRLDDVDIGGLLSIDGYVDAQSDSPEYIADLILKRLHVRPLTATDFKKPRWRAGLAALALPLAAWFLYVQPLIDRHLGEARRYLSSGRYAEAAQAYEQAIPLAPFRRDVRLLKDIAELGRDAVAEERPDAGKLDARLAALLEQAPGNPHLLVLDGLRLYHQGDLRGAEGRYREAIQSDPNLAEAYFNLGVLHEDPGEAEPWFYKARELAPGSPTYRDAHAAVDLERGRYAEAIAQYAAIPQYPLAKLEEAKARWALGELERAEARQQEAADWLANANTAASPWNQYPWDFDTGAQTVSLRSLACKRYYAALAVAATRHLLGTQTELPSPGACAQAIEAKQAVAEDIRRYALVQPGQAQAGQVFMSRLLAR